MAKNRTAVKGTLSSQELAVLFEENIQLAERIAFKFSRKYDIWQEALQEEALSLLGIIIARWHVGGEGQAPYNGKASPKTWIYRILWWQLQTWVRRQTKPCSTFTFLSTDETEFEPAAQTTFLQRILHEVGEEAAVLINTLVHAPIELVDEIRGSAKQQTKKSVRSYLENTLGWHPNDVTRAWKEVEACLLPA